jgi:hypothetical protein
MSKQAVVLLKLTPQANLLEHLMKLLVTAIVVVSEEQTLLAVQAVEVLPPITKVHIS